MCLRSKQIARLTRHPDRRGLNGHSQRLAPHHGANNLLQERLARAARGSAGGSSIQHCARTRYFVTAVPRTASRVRVDALAAAATLPAATVTVTDRNPLRDPVTFTVSFLPRYLAATL